MQLYSIPISRPLKRTVTACWDAVILSCALIFAFALSGADFAQQEQNTLVYLGGALLLSLLVFARLGLYRMLVLYMGIQSSLLLAQCVTLATALLAGALAVF